jgi:formate hydrogenlyase subunit 6/NADH:ubiquinone oxidoreductase subunit I
LNAIGYESKRAKLLSGQAVTSASSTTESGHVSRRFLLSLPVISFLFPSLLKAESSKQHSVKKSVETDSPLPKGQSTVGYVMNDPILPPGAGNIHRYRKHCSACHLCITKCPANVLTPSVTELGMAGFLQPVMKFDYGFCNYDCMDCIEVCPSHVLRVHSREQKHRIQVGEVVFLQENCVVHTQGTNCGACAEHCPTGAIKMVPFGNPANNLLLPEIGAEFCIGCGACEHICPVSPYRAIYVKGLAKQGEAKPAYDPNEKQQEIKLDDFGF